MTAAAEPAPLLPPWLRASGSDWLLSLHVQPGARQTEVQGIHGDALKLRLAAPPVDGKANTELLRFLAARIGMPRNCFELVAGQASRQKKVRVTAGVQAVTILSALGNDERGGALG